MAPSLVAGANKPAPRSTPSAQSSQPDESGLIPARIVGDRLRQLKNIARQQAPDERIGFAIPASRNTLIEEPQVLPLEQNYHGIDAWRRGRRVPRYSSSSVLRAAMPGVSRTDTMTSRSGNVRNRYKQQSTESYLAPNGGSSATDPMPLISLSIPEFSVPLSSSGNNSESSTSTARRQDALEIFEQYGISRPAGWLSEDDTANATPNDPAQTREFRVCHSCGETLNSRKYCPHCGHDACLKCKSELPGDEARPGNITKTAHENHTVTVEHTTTHSTHETIKQEQDHTHSTRVTILTTEHQGESSLENGSETPKARRPVGNTYLQRSKRAEAPKSKTQPKPAALKHDVPRAVKHNIFMMADKKAKPIATAPGQVTRDILVKPPAPELSDEVRGRQLRRSSSGSQSQGQCSNPECRATHAGHHPFRHSISCSSRRRILKPSESNELEVVEIGEEENTDRQIHSPLPRLSIRRADASHSYAEDGDPSQREFDGLIARSRELSQRAASRRSVANFQKSRSLTRSDVLQLPQPSRWEHSISRDEKTLMDYSIARHSLRRDTRVVDAVPTETHQLVRDPTFGRELSPKSHNLPADVYTKVANLTEPHTISQDSEVKTKRQVVDPVRESIPMLRPVSPKPWHRPSEMSMLSSVRMKSRETKNTPQLRRSGGRAVAKAETQPNNTFMLLSTNANPPEQHSLRGPAGRAGNTEETSNSLLSSLPTREAIIERPSQPRPSFRPQAKPPRETKTSIPHTQHSLRRVSRSLRSRDQDRGGVLEPLSWRQQLRKVEKSEEGTQGKATTPPAMKWRRSLSRVPRSPHSEAGKDCVFCYPSEASSTQNREATSQHESRDGMSTTHDHTHVMTQSHQPAEYELMSSRLKVKQIEQSLAQKSAESTNEEEASEGGIEEEPSSLPQALTLQKREVKTAKDSTTSQFSSYAAMEPPIKIRSPKPALLSNHVCAWRTRYMNLNSEVQQLKAEMEPRTGQAQGISGRDTGRGGVRASAASAQHERPDVDIESLTIVMHMRGKDDLVINTNLKESD
ncbi:hypothetical protein G7046_g6725 [Stylonectria norvegica]|nr:hypothetical protein G7046_g6725 [Stylonectria norvegica]